MEKVMTIHTNDRHTVNDLYAKFRSFDFWSNCATSYPAASKADIARCQMDDAALAEAKHEALRETLAGVRHVPANRRRELHIIAGLPAAFKSNAADQILQTLNPRSAANVDFDRFRCLVPGAAQFSQAFPMDADAVSVNAGAIRDSVLK